MGRILAIDYGRKRIGVAASDPSQIIATAIATVENAKIFDFLQQYISSNECEKLVIGYPKTLQNEPAEIVGEIESFIGKFSAKFPAIEVIRYDERFTSKLAFQTMIDSGIGKRRRADKALVDKIAATILLENYLESVRGV